MFTLPDLHFAPAKLIGADNDIYKRPIIVITQDDESGTAMAFETVPAITVTVQYISRFNFSPGLSTTMRACNVLVFGSTEDDT